eukprot:NODE_3730_length_638_cov_110.762309_g2681_i0.p1 GENE.NODE_3730_length_638_cov_110.762309_g2681_i0~~NODE_3730_length_638_cov_110.762309_g2681_i0.p1  ORF type:complete len:160 (+),score=21.17 NODE_3730_length_638_cov_110.762309_g2681_i0:143-622(+)
MQAMGACVCRVEVGTTAQKGFVRGEHDGGGKRKKKKKGREQRMREKNETSGKRRPTDGRTDYLQPPTAAGSRQPAEEGEREGGGNCVARAPTARTYRPWSWSGVALAALGGPLSAATTAAAAAGESSSHGDEGESAALGPVGVNLGPQAFRPALPCTLR